VLKDPFGNGKNMDQLVLAKIATADEHLDCFQYINTSVLVVVTSDWGQFAGVTKLFDEDLADLEQDSH